MTTNCFFVNNLKNSLFNNKVLSIINQFDVTVEYPSKINKTNVLIIIYFQKYSILILLIDN